MANHLPDPKILGAVAQLSCDLLSAAVHSSADLVKPNYHDALSEWVYDLAQLHIERCQAIYQAATERDPAHPPQ